jgi:hypothetical protein
MNNDPYAPPKAVVDDVISGPPMTRPWQVRVAVAICWLIVVFTIPEFFEGAFLSGIGDVREKAFLAFLIGFAVGVLALLAVLNVLLARGYRWARIVFSVFSLLDLLTRIQNALTSFDQGWYMGLLNVLEGLLTIAALCLLFTGPANAWFRTRGGQVEAA